MPIIVQGPTLANPDGFNSVAELRRELHRANHALLDYATALDARDKVGNELTGLVHWLLRQHLRGDHRGVAAILDQVLDSNHQLRENIEETNESNEIGQARQWQESARSRPDLQPLPPYNGEGDDPWSMKTIPELREALDIANRTGVNLATSMDSLQRVLTEMTAEVSKIVIAHVKGDRDAVSRALSTFCEKHVVVKDDPAQKVH